MLLICGGSGCQQRPPLMYRSSIERKHECMGILAGGLGGCRSAGLLSADPRCKWAVCAAAAEVLSCRLLQMRCLSALCGLQRRNFTGLWCKFDFIFSSNEKKNPTKMRNK